MFDIFKGVGMLMIVFGHTFSISLFFDDKNYFMVVLQLLLSLIYIGLMPAFFIVSGYGFRKRPVKKCVKQQLSFLLKPYLIVAVSTVLLHFVFHYMAFRYFPASVKETIKVAVGFLLALPQNKDICGITFFGCGTMWYIVALLIGWILLDIFMNYIPEKYVDIAVIASATLGWLIGVGNVIPFCISQGMIAVGFMRIGYQIKKAKFFERQLEWYGKIGIILSCIFSILLLMWTGKLDNMDEGIWVAGPISMLMDAFIGVGILILVLKLNQLEHPLLRFVQMIGRDSLLIFCVHTVEMIAIPWYLLKEHYSGIPFLGNMLVLLLRWCVIAAVVFLIKHRRSFIGKLYHRIQEREKI